MDNQLFPGGNAFLDDVPQVCPICGLMFNNTLTYQHHMQLHFLSAATNAQMLGTQPPPDPGIGMSTPASILDLIGGVPQHTLASSAAVSMVPPQAVFSGTAISTLPPHLISPGGGLATSALPNLGIPRQTTGRVKEKKSKSKAPVISTTSSINTSSTNLLSASSTSANFKSSDSSINTYISTFPKDLQKLDPIQSNPPNAQLIPPKPPADMFQTSSTPMDPLEALLLPSPVKQTPSVERQVSRNSSGSPQDSFSVSKDVKKLFQPFVSNDTSVTASFVSKSNVPFNTNSMISPIKNTGNKHDVLTTPQKSSYQSNTENLFSSPPTMSNTHSSDIHHFGLLQDNETDSASVDRKLDLPTKMAHHADDSVSMKSQYFPGIVDSSSISPKSGQTARKNDAPVDPLLKMNVMTGSVDHSQSSSPVSRAALIGDFGPARPDSPRSIVSPKISPALPGGVLDTESATLPAKSHIFASDVLPSASVPSIVPPAFGNTVGANTGVSSLASPAIDMAVNPLGTGYLNALTQKLFNPSFSMGSDFNKPSSSAAPGCSDDLKGKSYFENGVLISNDYDKISDTNDEDDLDRWIDDIDNKSDNNIACEIDDLLNEFNEKQTEDMKNKSQVDDFIKDVIGDPSVSKPAPKVADASLKVDDIFNPSDEFERNKSLISEILEEEKEKIDKESKELENARLSASGLFSSTSTSTSVTVSSSATTSTFTSVSNTDPKMSSSASSEIHDKKDDDHLDFEIPKVGKLMKIRKYFENREQKRKEQTEKVAEIKIHEKTEPVIEDKPQTILVQVSKRKKIEYGPYLNRQSLLEGKPKNVENNSPPKAYRPKPKPQLPEKRTFNLRERKTKTDFATLASTGSRTAETKRLEQKQKTGEKGEKEKYNEEINDLSVEDKSEKTEDIVTDNKIVTRNQEKKKDSAVEEKNKPKRGSVKSNVESDNEKVKDSEGSAPDNESRKFSLRTRSAKNEKTDAAEGKNLRKRTTRSDVDSNSNRNKVKKTDDNEVKPGADTEEKITRSKSKLKTISISSDKSGIKKCSVNLGEKYTEPKIKISKQTDKVDKKDYVSIESKNGSDKLCEENQSGRNDVDVNKNCGVDEKTEYCNESEVIGTYATKGMDTVDGDNSDIHSENIVCDEEQDNQDKECTDPDGIDTKEGNIFDKLDQTDLKNEFVENVVHSKKADTQLVSITSTDNTDKKVTMKLKLGPDFQKAFDCVFNPKKRKHESLDDPDSKAGADQSKEQSIDDINTKKDNLNEDDVNNEDIDAASNDDSKNTKTGKKMKHSVENEFQRLVDEAMKEAQKEGDSGKQERYVNLRRRLNENVKYNVDDSDEDGDKSKVVLDDIAGLKTAKGLKSQVKSTPKGKLKQDPAITEFSKQLSAKKDVDVYDFTDTEMSDTDESAPKKLGFKPKYVSNLNLFGQKKLPFVSKPLSPSKSPEVENQMENVTGIDCVKMESDAENVSSEISYVGKTVEPLKIKISKIKPFKEKKHKHKKKKKKREKERRDDDLDKVDSGESRESMDCDSDKLINMNVEIKKTEEIKSVDSVSQENNSNNSNEGEDEVNDGVTSSKGFKKSKMKEKKHICEYCNVGFGQKCDLRRHVMIHTGERPYPCEICDKRFQRKTDLVKHTRTHTGEKPYACEFCDKRVSDKSQLNVHRRLHTGDRPYCCSKCGKRCITSSELSRHKAVHCGEKVERCSLCRKAFTIKECLGMHMKLHYRSRGKAFKCEKCAIGFDKKTDLDSHHCIDPMKNVYMCSECYEEFKDEMLYAEHIKNHDLGVLACNVCTNIFEDKHSLETHLCSLGMEKQRQFCCEICELEFQDSDALSSHLSLHDEDVGPFMCDLCPEIFTLRKHFVEHAKVHESVVENMTKSFTSKEDTKSVSKSNASSFDKGENVRNAIHATENGMMGPLKQEVDSDDVHFPAFDEKQDNRIDMTENMSINVKSEMSSVSFPCTSNRSRASVISGTFRIDDEPERKQASATAARVAFSKSNFHSDNPSMPRKANADSFNDRSADFLAEDNLFEPTDFTNSPDFSTLTEVDDMNSFDGLSESLTQESMTKSAKRQRASDKGEKSVNYFGVNQKLSHYSNSSQSFGFVPSSQCSDSPVDSLSSMRVLQKQKSQIGSIVTSETNPTHSSNSSQCNDRDIHRSLSTDHDFQIQEHQTKTAHSSSYPHSTQGKQWPGFSMSETDFFNSVLSNERKRDLDRFDSVSTSSKQNPLIQGHSKSDSGDMNSSSRADMYGKDNIENQMKSSLFSEFEINTSSQKSTMQGNKHGLSSDNNPSAGSFQGLNRSGFGTSRFPQNFSSEKSDFSVFGQPYMGSYPSVTSYSSSVNSSALSNSVTADVNKRHLQGLFSNRSDTLHNNFYLPDTMKDVTGADKGADDTTSLLSNFDQF